jgi:hypothetical protein
MTAAISTKAATSPRRPHSTVRLLCPMSPPQVDTSDGKPSGTYGEGEAEKSTGPRGRPRMESGPAMASLIILVGP